MSYSILPGLVIVATFMIQLPEATGDASSSCGFVDIDLCMQHNNTSNRTRYNKQKNKNAVGTHPIVVHLQLGLAWAGWVHLGLAWYGSSRLGLTWLDSTRSGSTRPWPEPLGSVRRCLFSRQPRYAWPGAARISWVLFGSARPSPVSARLC